MKFASRLKIGPSSRKGLTLAEIVVTMGVFSIVVVALIYSHIVGLMQDQLVQSKLGATETSRRGFDRILQEIRSAKNMRVGSFNGTTFTPIPNGSIQQGNALELNYLSLSNWTTNIYYYFAASAGDNKLYRLHTGDTKPTVIASNLVTTLIFTAENYRGSPETNTECAWQEVVHFTLNFQEYQYPITKVGPSNCLFDTYKMDFRATAHAPD